MDAPCKDMTLRSFAALRAAQDDSGLFVEANLVPLLCFGFFEGLGDGGFGEGGHDGVALGVGVEAVFTDVGFEEAVFVHGGGEIVEVDVAVGGGVFFDPGVELEDFFRWALGAHVDGFAFAIVAVVADRKDAGEDDADLVGVGELVHRLEIAFDLIERHGAGVAGEVVGAGKDDDDFWLERDDIGAETDEHLRSGLAADAAVDVRLAGKEAAEFWANPGVGDGVAHEDDALFGFGGRFYRGVGVVVAGDVGPVLESFLIGNELFLHRDRGGVEDVAVAWLVGRLGWSLRTRCGDDGKSCSDEE